MYFQLQIELGNDAMQTWGDVHRALIRTAGKIGAHQIITEHDRPPAEGNEARLRDENGNTVGGWQVAERQMAMETVRVGQRAKLAAACRIFCEAFRHDGYIPALGKTRTDEAVALIRDAGYDPWPEKGTR